MATRRPAQRLAPHKPVQKQAERRHSSLPIPDRTGEVPIDYPRYRAIAFKNGCRLARFRPKARAAMMEILKEEVGLDLVSAERACCALENAASVYLWWRERQCVYVADWPKLVKQIGVRIEQANKCRAVALPTDVDSSPWIASVHERIAFAFREIVGYPFEDWVRGLDQLPGVLGTVRASFTKPPYRSPDFHRGWMEDQIAGVLQNVGLDFTDEDGRPLLTAVLKIVFKSLELRQKDYSKIVSRLVADRSPS